jgi:hypothetical protein
MNASAIQPHPPRPRRSTAATAMVVALSGTLLAGKAFAARPAPPALAHCQIVRVQPGQTVWAIYGGDIARAHRYLDSYISDINRVYVGDELVVGCDAPPPPAVPAVEIGTALTVEADHSLVDVSQYLNGTNVKGKLSWETVLSLLYTRGVEGNDLLTLAAITEGESGRNPLAEGDQSLADAKWGSSWGAWQVRSVRSAKGTGSLYESAKVKREQGQVHPVTKKVWDPFCDWTAHLNGWDVGVIPQVRAVAQAMGLLR